MHRRLFAVLPLLAAVLLAQKKPVTLADVYAAKEKQTPELSQLVWAPDGKSFLYTRSGTVSLYDVASHKSRELFALSAFARFARKTAPAEGFAWENRGVHEEPMQWTPDGASVLVSSDGDLFLWRVAGGGFEQLTSTPVAERDPKLSPDGQRVAFRRDHDLYVLNLKTRSEVRLTTDGSATILNGELDWVYPEELALGTAFWWSPDSKRLAYLQFDVSREPTYPHADLLRPKALYEPQRYPQAGDPNASVRLGVVAVTGGSTKWMDVGSTIDQFLIARVYWTPDSQRLFVERPNRVQNNLDLLSIDAATGDSSLILRETDPFWINVHDDFRVLRDGKHFLWSSERDGFRHLYLYPAGGGTPVRLTSGEWEVRGVAGIDEAKGIVYFLSSEPSPIESHLYSVRLDGTGKQRLTADPGTHNISMPQTADAYVDTYSSLKSPPRQALFNTSGQETAVLTERDTKVLDKFNILPTEILKVKAADGTTEMYARLIRPAGFDPAKKYPLIIDVYGGPDARTIHNAWPGMSVDQVLANDGFVIFQVDNRGSTGRGHAYETPIYHKLGATEFADQKAALEQLLAMGFVDRSRIGISGWSYGGFMTLNCMLNAPDLYRAGIAGAPVTNYRNYDSIYTERYMGLPAENPVAYNSTDLSKLAGNLAGKLMLVHNLDDDNVLFANTLQMTNALQSADKQFEFMLYPQKTHGVYGKVARQMSEAMVAFFERELK